MVEFREVCITLLFMGIDSEESNLILVIVQGGLRVESNPTFFGLLNGDVGALVALNFGNKPLSLISCNIYFLKFLLLFYLLRVHILTQGLIRLIEYSYHQGIPSFLKAQLKRTLGLSVLSPEQFQDG
jgi:hypothetical protein